jgi:hypothetical protein
MMLECDILASRNERAVFKLEIAVSAKQAKGVISMERGFASTRAKADGIIGVIQKKPTST